MKSQRSNPKSKLQSGRDWTARPFFKKTVLPNGVRVLTEHHPTSRAVSCGIWVDRGTRDERPGEEGLAHFVEHMVFKRTRRRSAYEISRDMEAVGGDLNAFTSREYTCYVTHSLKEHLSLSLDVLADLATSPLFEASDIRKEKSVVVQEIRMAEDQLDEHIYDRFFEMVFPQSRLGLPILGSARSIENLQRSQLFEFHNRQYQPKNLMVSVAGCVSHDEVVELAAKYLKIKGTKFEQPPAREPAQIEPIREVVKRPSEQAHILVGFPSSDFRSPHRFEAFIVNSLLGGGLTSRLYQTVREEKGLVYSIYSQLATFVDTGMMTVYAGTEPKQAPTVIELIMKEIRRIRRNGLKRSELEFFKCQVKGQILLGGDDIESRMNSIAVNEMVNGRYRSVDDVIRDVEGVSMDSIHEYIDSYFDLNRVGLLVMGPLPEGPMRRWLEGI